MSRRTFPRGVAAGLIAAALSSPAAGQTPNPWRGETALPTAPAPRAVAAKPTRQLSIGLGFSSVGGLTVNVDVRESPRATPALKATRVETIPMPRELPTMTYPDGTVVRTSYLTRAPDYMPPPPPLPIPAIPPAAP